VFWNPRRDPRKALFGALRYQQGVSITRPALGESRTLAPPSSCGRQVAHLGGDDGADVFAPRPRKERELYFTATGRPTAARAVDASKLVDLQQRVRDAKPNFGVSITSAEAHRRSAWIWCEHPGAKPRQLDVIAERKKNERESTRRRRHAVELLKLAREKAEASERVESGQRSSAKGD